MHYGPRPRNQGSLDALDSASHTGSAALNNPDGLTTPDNCSVCKSIQSPTLETIPNDRVETKCNISVGSCVQAVDNSAECSSLSQILTHMCPCTSTTTTTPNRKDLHDCSHDGKDPLFVPEHVGMSTAFNCMHTSPCERSASRPTPRSTHRIPVRSNSEQSEDAQSSVSVPKVRMYPCHVRTNSDSALSASMTTASVAGTSISSLPMSQSAEGKVADDSQDIDAVVAMEDDLTKPLTASSLKSLLDASEFPPNNINTESLNILVQDFTKKIASLTREHDPSELHLYPIPQGRQGKSFERSTTESDLESDMETDPLLSNPSPDYPNHVYPSLEPKVIHFHNNNNEFNKSALPRAESGSNYSNKSSLDYSTNDTESDSGSDRLYMLRSRERGTPRRLTTIWNGGARKIPVESSNPTHADQHESESESPEVEVIRPSRPKLKRQNKIRNPLEVAQVDSGVIEDTYSASSANPSIQEDTSPVLKDKQRKARKFHKLQKRNSDSRISSKGPSSPSSLNRSLSRALTDGNESADSNRAPSAVYYSDNPGNERTWKETIL